MHTDGLAPPWRQLKKAYFPFYKLSERQKAFTKIQSRGFELLQEQMEGSFFYGYIGLMGQIPEELYC